MKMKRTQLYIKPTTHQNVAREAQRRRCTMAQLMRESLEQKFDGQPKKSGGAHVLLEMIKDAKRLEKQYPTSKDAPTDLAENHDYYLYGDGRI